MLTNSIIKYIRSLKEKKNRDQHKVFIAEGNKLVIDLLKTMSCQYLITSNTDIKTNSLLHSNIEQLIEVKDKDIKRVSMQQNPQQMLAVFYQLTHQPAINIKNKLTLVLDEIQDPGNLGTIVRLADWYGIENLICSSHTADIYNPKTVQATMGAIARVKVYYTDIVQFLNENKEIPIYGTFLDGENIYQKKLSENGIIVMGNEGKGISKEVEYYINNRLLIPSYPDNIETSESLNVAIATAITCAEFRRRIL